MAIPIIDTTTSVLGYRQGESWMYQPATTNTPAPTSWAWSGLPPGVAANETTGVIEGPATATGVFLTRLTATNDDGTSAPLVIPIGIFGRAWGDDGSLPINIDVRTGVVSPHDATQWGRGEPVAACKSGDHLIFDIGFTSNGVGLIPLDMSVILFGLKEFEPEGMLDVSDGSYETIGEWDDTRYRIICKIEAAKVEAALSNYEDDSGTWFDALCEIQWTQIVMVQGEPQALTRTSQTFLLRIFREMIVP